LPSRGRRRQQNRQLDELFAKLKTAKEGGGRRRGGRRIWKLWLQSGKHSSTELMEQASRLIGAGLPPLALPILDDIVARAPGWAEGWNKRATALYLAGEHDRSLAEHRSRAGAGARAFGALAGIGLIRITKGEFREALAATQGALVINPLPEGAFPADSGPAEEGRRKPDVTPAAGPLAVVNRDLRSASQFARVLQTASRR
jgi:hypothetical protein